VCVCVCVCARASINRFFAFIQGLTQFYAPFSAKCETVNYVTKMDENRKKVCAYDFAHLEST